MILVTMTIDGTDHYISTSGQELTHYWNPRIIRCDSISYRLDNQYGGYMRPKYGRIELAPSLFRDVVLPPASCPVVIQYSSTTEEAAITIFSGVAHRASIARNKVIYDLFGPEYDVLVSAGAHADTLVNIFTTYCGVAYLDLTLDSTAARAVSPAVDYTPSSDQQCLDLLSDIAAFFTHGFYISGSTLYLVDMLGNNGTLSLDGFDYYIPRYSDNPAYAIFKAGDDTVEGSYAYGRKSFDVSPVCHDTAANIEDALDDIKTIIERPRVLCPKPIGTTAIPVLGQKISFTEENWIDKDDSDFNLSVDFWVRELNFDFTIEKVFLEGDGAITA